LPGAEVAGSAELLCALLPPSAQPASTRAAPRIKTGRNKRDSFFVRYARSATL